MIEQYIHFNNQEHMTGVTLLTETSLHLELYISGFFVLQTQCERVSLGAQAFQYLYLNDDFSEPAGSPHRHGQVGLLSKPPISFEILLGHLEHNWAQKDQANQVGDGH